MLATEQRAKIQPQTGAVGHFHFHFGTGTG